MAKFKFTTSKKNRLKLLSCTAAVERPGALCGSHIEGVSNKEITVDGCKSIVEYNGEYVKLKTVDGYISVFGNMLNIPVYEGPVITVAGVIGSIEFNIR